MAADYRSIRATNEKGYGTYIPRIGQMLLVDRYDDRTHFIYELLQNAEDALSRRIDWGGSRAVKFALQSDVLKLSHYGQPFDDRDVQAICAIGESSKDEAAIGRFGIGFKSVYAYTSRPEIHSGLEDFAIESFVWPAAVGPIARSHDATVFLLPLDIEPSMARIEITRGFQRLGPRTLLFLREIEEIEWSVSDGPSGVYLRSKPETLGEGVRRVSVLGQEANHAEVEESWLIFSREVYTGGGVGVGQIEIAFSMLTTSGDENKWTVQPVVNSELVVFFPTVVPTNLAVLVQGPYKTTPSRDNVPQNDPWNQKLVKETAALFLDALAWLRADGRLNVNALRCLPLERSKFPAEHRFASLFDTVRDRLKAAPFLPTATGGHTSATGARLARTQELRNLLSPTQLATLFTSEIDLAWLSGDISQDRTPEVRQYAMRELEIPEVTPEMMVTRLTKAFLEAQSDQWLQLLYEFLLGQPALLRSGRLSETPLVRLNNGSHVLSRQNGRLRAFLPGPTDSGFPTVRRSVCESKDARRFLELLGLTIPDPVDDVMWNVLPSYREGANPVPDAQYQRDMHRILEAFGTDSKTQQEKLITALRGAGFVKAVRAENLQKAMVRPSDVYFSTTRLKALFAGIEDVLMLDDQYDCLRGEEMRKLLEACGVARSLRPVSVVPGFTWEELLHLRISGGCESSSGGNKFTDYSLLGLDQILAAQSEMDRLTKQSKASLLWEALGEVQERRGEAVFTGLYEWTYHRGRSADFDSTFVRRLNAAPWIPDKNGELRRPGEVIFDDLRWKPNSFLLSKIRFKAPMLDALAKEAGFEPGVLDLLMTLGVTSEAALRSRLGLDAKPAEAKIPSTTQLESDDSSGATSDRNGDQINRTTHVSESPTDGTVNSLMKDHNVATPVRHKTSVEGAPDRNGKGFHPATSSDPTSAQRTAFGNSGNRPFVSYIASDPGLAERSDPDGLEPNARMELEEKAIRVILSLDPRLERTPTHNRGFDLFEPDSQGRPQRWVEVKAMTGSLLDRPVCLSQAQFDCAWTHGEAFWLYIVERAGDDQQVQVLRIQDPAGKGKYFAFDQGWRKIAELAQSTVAGSDSPNNRLNEQ